MSHVIDQQHGKNWQMYLGDSCQVLKGVPANSIDFCIHSPPFSNLYIYSDSEADLGNCIDDDEFIRHYEFIISELFRVSVFGRLCAVHCKDLPKYANRDDTAGLKDFPGKIVAAFERHGWSYHSRVTIWKCPVVERERTNNNGLLHKTIIRDSSQVRQGMADYLLVFRKPPVGTLMSDKPIARPNGIGSYVGNCDPRQGVPRGIHRDASGLPIDAGRDGVFHPSPYSRRPSANGALAIWQRYAEPVWWDIDQMDVLNNFRAATSDEDERHICPLQLDLIERAVELWSAPGDVVLSPFAGVGSEGIGSLRRGRKFVGIELKPEYFRRACTNLGEHEENAKVKQPTLAGLEIEPERQERADAQSAADLDSLLS